MMKKQAVTLEIEKEDSRNVGSGLSEVGMVSANSQTTSKVTLKPPLSDVLYNRDELDEIINKIPLDGNTNATINARLEIVENRVDSIHESLRSKNPANFYADIRLSLTEIKNAAAQIYELAKPYRITLANQLQKKILNCIAPLDKELSKRMEVSETERLQLEFKTKRLYVQQSFICRQEDLQPRLMDHLGQIRQMLLDTNSLEPHCYLSYAWPSHENKGHEYWIQPFLSILYDHLKQAGIEMIMDIRNNRPGHDIYQFMGKYKDGNHVILIGTESLLQKHESYKAHAVKTELSIINERFEQDMEQFGESRIHPLLISGTHKSSFPPIYDKYRTVREGRDNGYLLLLKNLIEWLYSLRIAREAGLKLRYQTLWSEFLSNYPGLSNDCTEVQVMQELAEDYHRKRLDELNQDLVYQSIRAQQDVKHSEAVTTKIIAAYMESIGPLPKALFEGNGQQFQRPYINHNFVERKSLWDKMLTHFGSQEKLVLMAAHGLGGMGKTELAGYYYQHPPRPYSLRAWFYAATRSQLYQQYIELAEDNGKFFPKEMPIEEQAQMVKQWLEEQKDCLLVYDNVENASEIDGLLPEQGKHHILITSRNAEDFPAEQCVAVDIMEEFEAIELIVKITGINKDRNLEQLKELVKELGYLPLALAQAASFMGKTISIIEYLNIYRQRQAELLSNKDEKNPLSPKHEPIWITFDINFKAHNMDFPPAIATLKQASWVASAAIPEILLSSIVEEYNGEKDKLLLWANVKKHVHRYSFMRVDTERHLMSIHQVLQDIVRSKQQASEQIATFEKVCDTLGMVFNNYKAQNNNYKVLLAHAERLHQHSIIIEKLASANNTQKTLLLVEPLCLSEIYLRLGLPQKALEPSTKTLSIYESIYGKNDIEIVGALNQLGNINLSLYDPLSARSFFERALQISEAYYGVGHIETAPDLGSVGNVYSLLEDFQEAKIYHEKALNIYEEAYGPEDFRICEGLINLCNAYGQIKNYIKAKTFGERALKILKEHYVEDHVSMAPLLENLGLTYKYLEDYAESIKCIEWALKIKQTHYGDKHFECASALINLGSIYSTLQNYEKAKECYLQAFEINKAEFGENHVLVSIDLYSLGVISLQLKDFMMAKDYFSKTLKIQENHYVSNLKLLITLRDLAIACLELKEFDDGWKYLLRAYEICCNNPSETEPYLKLIEELLGYAVNNLPNQQENIDLLLNMRSRTRHSFEAEEDIVKKYDTNEDEEELEKAIELSLENEESEEIEPSSHSLYSDQQITCYQAGVNRRQQRLLLSSKLCQSGFLFYNNNLYIEALKFFKHALKKQYEAQLILLNEDIATLNYNVGVTYLKLQNYGEAQPHLQTAYELRFKLLGEDNEKTQKAKERLEKCMSMLLAKDKKQAASNEQGNNFSASSSGAKLKPKPT